VDKKELKQPLGALFAKIDAKELTISTDLASEYYQELMIQGRPEQAITNLLRQRLEYSPERFGTAPIRRILKSIALYPLKVQVADRTLGQQVLTKLLPTILDAGVNYSATILYYAAAAGFQYHPNTFQMLYEVAQLKKFVHVQSAD
jgi:hypothetical protein